MPVRRIYAKLGWPVTPAHHTCVRGADSCFPSAVTALKIVLIGPA